MSGPAGAGTAERAVRPVALVILDGWGLAPEGPGNAVALADTPTFDRLWRECPRTTLEASGLSVGLPAGQIGNSEVGHLNLGAGRVVYQDLARIDRSIELGELEREPALLEAIAAARESGSAFHVLALASTGGVHSHMRHVEAVVLAAARAGINRVLVHAITDGRDVAPDAALTDLPALETYLQRVSQEHGCDARIVTVIGRYWAMDRDRRWDRTRRAYDVLTTRLGRQVATAAEAVRVSHAEGITDEFVEPFVVVPGGADEAAQPGVGSVDAIRDGDVVFCANFRPDRMRQIVHAFVDAQFTGFERSVHPHVRVVTMTRYESTIDVPVVFRTSNVHNTLADVLEHEGLKQLHVAETEKYAHVTYFFNGGMERAHEGELRMLADSPRDVATYDLKPQMAAEAAADIFCGAIAADDIDFAIINFANPDMVGHTGSIPAAVAAVETVDRQLSRVVEAVHARGGACIVTADHGNAEMMLTPEGTPHTAHTTNPVPFLVTGAADTGLRLREGGKLADVAPTVLALLGVAQPEEMTGESLVVAAHERASSRSGA